MSKPRQMKETLSRLELDAFKSLLQPSVVLYYTDEELRQLKLEMEMLDVSRHPTRSLQWATQGVAICWSGYRRDTLWVAVRFEYKWGMWVVEWNALITRNRRHVGRRSDVDLQIVHLGTKYTPIPLTYASWNRLEEEMALFAALLREDHDESR